ncbi:MAG: hypothetical protein ACI9WU_003027, partial [Myxococcota bacterium]
MRALLSFCFVSAWLLSGCGDQSPKPPAAPSADKSRAGGNGTQVGVTPDPQPDVQTPDTPAPVAVKPAGSTPPKLPDLSKKQTPGLRLSIGDGEEDRQKAVPRATLAPATKLDDASAQKLLGRLPPLEPEKGDDPEFAFRERSKPAPRPGETVKEPFPPIAAPDVAAPDVARAEPKVLRFSPEGDVALAPNLSVTFDQPMVPVTSHDEIAKLKIPVALDPEPKGQWRWVGTKTVLFVPEGRFPMATEYTASVAKTGTQWTFTTPPPKVIRHWPSSGPIRRDTIFFAEFDQQIDPKAVLKTTRLSGGGLPALNLTRDLPKRLATEAEIERNETLKSLVGRAHKGRWIAVRADDLLPGDTSIELAFDAGTPSAEGPGVTKSRWSRSVRTFGPLTLEESRCGWRGKCPPFATWTLRFNNPLDAEAFDQDQVQVQPKLPGLNVQISGRRLNITGRTKGRTKYNVVVSGKLRDTFGQTLGKDEEMSFKVGSANPRFSAQGGNFVVLDPAGKPTYPIYTVNHDKLKVTIYNVQATDWKAFQEYARSATRREKRPKPPGKRVHRTTTITVASLADEVVQTNIDLAKGLKGGHGQVVVEIEPLEHNDNKYRRTVAVAWVQSTNLGIDAIRDGTHLNAWVTRLTDGKPVHGASVRMIPDGIKGSTGADGLTALELPSASNERIPRMLIVTAGGDTAILPENRRSYGYGSSWHKQERAPQFRWMIFDDRKLYRPGETARIKGWLRSVSGGKAPMLGALKVIPKEVRWVLKDSRNNEVTKGSAAVTGLGGFDFEVPLSDTMNLGHATLHISQIGGQSLSGGTTRHQLRVQEFRRPEFEVKTSKSEAPHFIGTSATATVEAKYFAGGALPGTPVQWRVKSQLTNYTPPNRWEYAFGAWVPWWGRQPNAPGQRHLSHSGTTDAGGKHTLALDFETVHPSRPASVSAEATVQDVNRQAFTSTATFLVHPASLYVGLKVPRSFVKPGDELKASLIAVDLDGKAVAGRTMVLEAVRVEWRWVKGRWTQVEKDRDRCEVTSKADAVTCRFEPKAGGSLKLTATIVDDLGRPNTTERTVWVAGGRMPSVSKVTQEKVTLIPDAKEYQPGDTAEVLIQAPFPGAEALLTVRLAGIVHQERFTIDESSHTLRIPIAEEHVPSLSIRVDLVGAAARLRDGEPDPKLPKRPAYAAGQLTLSVPPTHNRLAIEVVPLHEKLDPGGETSVTVTITDADENPVEGAEVAIIIVDESVLALTGYSIPDPIAAFYAAAGFIGGQHHLRKSVLLAELDSLALKPTEPRNERRSKRASATAKPRSMSADSAGAPPGAPEPEMVEAEEGMMDDDSGGGGDGGQPAIKLRTNFDALAVFAAAERTDGGGKVVVPVTLPDNLTRYRITAVAVHGGRHYGKGESNVTARLPLMVRPSAPRFLNFGDTMELPLVLQNQTDKVMHAQVAARSLGLELTDGAGRSVTIPANDRVEVRLPAKVSRVGTGRIQIAAAAGSASDAATVTLPIWTPATTEAFATYGTVDKGAIKQSVRAPANVVPQFGSLNITTSSTAVQALTDAVLYLVDYPYGCSEQVSSRVMSIASLKDVLEAFEAPGMPSKRALLASIDKDMKRLSHLQNGDGGWGWWRAGSRSWPYLTVHVTHALIRVKQKGFSVPAGMLRNGLRYLKRIERHFPSTYPESVKRSITAYALYVRNLNGDKDPAKARSILAAEGGPAKANLELVGWLWNVLSGDSGSSKEIAAIRRHVANRATEDASKAHFVTSYSDGAHLLLHSSRRADGILLEAMIGDQPDSTLIPKVVRGLLAHRKKGRWGNTQENAWVLLALDRYFNTYEKTTPDFVARVWLGKDYAGDHKFKGRTTERSR